MANIGMATSKVHRMPREYVELPMKLHERFALLSEEGEFWYIARNALGAEGYIPSTSLTVDGKDPSVLLYLEWRTNCDRLMQEGSISLNDWHHLAVPKQFMLCDRLECSAWKRSHDGSDDQQPQRIACTHDLHSFLSAEANYSASWLKTERLRWHPDRFRLKCTDDARDVLAKKAGEMFALITKLYEREVVRQGSPGDAKLNHEKTRKASDMYENTSPHSPQPASPESKSTLPVSNDKCRQNAPNIPLHPAPPSKTNQPPNPSESSSSGSNLKSSIPATTAAVASDGGSDIATTARPLERVPSLSNDTCVTSRDGTRPTAFRSTSLNPAAKPFKVQSTPATWSSFATAEKIKEHDKKIEESPSSVLDEWFSGSPLMTSGEEKHRSDTCFSGLEAQQAYYVRGPAKCAAGITSVTPSFAERAKAIQSGDDRHQWLLAKARNIKAQAIKTLAENAKKDGNITYHDQSEQRQKRADEIARLRRARWCKPLPLDQRVAQQEMAVKKAHKMELSTGANQQQHKADDWS